MECIFCKIINEEIPSYTIYEDDKVKAFLDIEPDVNGHTLIIPKKHYQDIEDIDIDNYDSFDLLYLVGKKRGMLVSGGEVNTERAAIMLLDEFRAAKLGRITMEMPYGG